MYYTINMDKIEKDIKNYKPTSIAFPPFQDNS